MQHFEGAATLIKQRKRNSTTSELSKRLLIGVRSNIVCWHERCELFHADVLKVARAIATSSFIDGDSELWQDLSDPMPYNPATLLDCMCVEVANLLAHADQTSAKVFDFNHDETRRANDTSDLVRRAELVDAKLAMWPDMLSSNWSPVRVLADAIPQDVVGAGLYGDSCDVYADIIICSTWNDWRQTRLKVLALIVRLGDNDSRAVAITTIQQLADDICASVPFSLGSRVKISAMYAADANYPCVAGQRVSMAHQQRAAAVGGWNLFSPLKGMFHLGMYLRKGQGEWVGRQLIRLATIYNIRPVLDILPAHQPGHDQ